MTIAQSAAVVWLAGIAPLASLLIPVLLPVMQQRLHLTPRELSLVASANLSGACISAVTAPLWLSKISSRQASVLGLAIVALTNAAAAYATAPVLLLPLMLLAGVGSGLSLCGGIPLVRRVAKPARLMSAVQVFQLLVAAAALGGAGWLLSFAGVRELFLIVVAAALVSIPIAMALPAGGAPADHHLPTLAELRPGGRALIAIFIYFASIAILTNYAGDLGVQNGLSLAFVSSAMAIGNLGALPGSLIAALANDRPRQRWFLIGATLLEGLALLTMTLAHDAIVFGAAFFAIQVGITIVVPIQVAFLVDQDASGRSIQAMGAMQAVGQAVGPLSVTFAITAAGVGNAYYWAVLYIVVSAVLFIRPWRRHSVAIRS